MRQSLGLARRLIIGVLASAALLGLGGCSALRLGYNNGPQLAWWWLDGYLDFPREQSPAVKTAIDRWFEWHRATQLAGYASMLSAMQAQTIEATSPAALCRLWGQAREALDPALDRAVLLGAELVPALTDAQLRHLEQRYAKNLDEMRDEYLQRDPAERRRASVKRAIDRAEQLYGTLGEAQRRVVTEGVAASPFDPDAWVRERRARQRDAVHTLRRLVAEKADRDARVAALRVLVERSERSPDPEYRDYQRRLTDYNCAFAARIHNATTPAQRQHARETLKGWEEDARALMTPPAVPPLAPGGLPG